MSKTFILLGTTLCWLLCLVSSAFAQSPKQEAQSTGNEKDKQCERWTRDSVMDRTGESSTAVIVVPAGTELKVDVDNRHTIVPVRVGFATPIPALSHVEIQVSRDCFNGPYVSDNTTSFPEMDCLEYANVTTVTVGGSTYDIQTNMLPLSRGGTNNDLTFVLDRSVAVTR